MFPSMLIQNRCMSFLSRPFPKHSVEPLSMETRNISFAIHDNYSKLARAVRPKSILREEEASHNRIKDAPITVILAPPSSPHARLRAWRSNARYCVSYLVLKRSTRCSTVRGDTPSVSAICQRLRGLSLRTPSVSPSSHRVASRA